MKTTRLWASLTFFSALLALFIVTGARAGNPGEGTTFVPVPFELSKMVMDTPELLNWPLEHADWEPNFAEPTANSAKDLHMQLRDCDMAFATLGNYHMALTEIWKLFLAKFPADKPLRNWVYTTTPPLFGQAFKSGGLRLDNAEIHCPLQAVVLRPADAKILKERGLLAGEPVPFAKVKGFALLVKKGNPKKIKSVWDLAKKDIQVAMAHPVKEPVSFHGYTRVLHAAAKATPNPPKGMDADKLMTAIFQANKPKDTAKTAKWLTVEYIHHRGVPWSIAKGHGDVSVMQLHLARHAARTFPDQLEVLEVLPPGVSGQVPGAPSGGDGYYIAKLKGEWTDRQKEATDKFVQTMTSPEAVAILEKHGLAKP